jgi:hypothetical protein
MNRLGLSLGVVILCAGCASTLQAPKAPLEGTNQLPKTLFVLEGEERCTRDLDELCRARAQALLNSEDLIARSVCQESPGYPVCAIGDQCVGDPTDWPPPQCVCAPGVICAPGEVCASKGPDGPPRCIGVRQ